MRPHNVQELFDELVRKGEIIKTTRIRNGQPVYVTREQATPEEIEAAARDSNQEK
jgi:hypothetical protein